MDDDFGMHAMVAQLLTWMNFRWRSFEMTKLPADSELTSYVLGITMMA